MIGESYDDGGRARAVKRVLLATLLLNLAVAAAKIAYGISAGALAIRADGFHSATDALNNVIALVGVALASRPPDAGHPYGHRKHELFAAGVIGLSLLVVAADVASDVVTRLRGAGTPPAIDGLAYVVLGLTLVVNVATTAYETRAAKRLQSPALEGDAIHTRSDVVVTLFVMLSAYLVSQGYAIADLVAGLAVAIFIGATGIGLIKRNAGYLLDAALVDPASVIAIAHAVPGVILAADVRTRGVPGEVFMDLRIQVPRHFTVVEAHDVSHRVMDALRLGIAGLRDVHVHAEPAGADM